MTQKAIIKNEIIGTINAEVEREKKEKDFPHLCFGRMTRDDALKLAIKYKGIELNVIGIEENIKLGKDYDLITVQIKNGEASFRRQYLNIIE